MTEDVELQPVNPNFKFNSTFKPASSHHFSWEGSRQTDPAQRIITIPTRNKSWPGSPTPPQVAQPGPPQCRGTKDFFSTTVAAGANPSQDLSKEKSSCTVLERGALGDRAGLAEHMFLCIPCIWELTKSGSFRSNNQEYWRFVLRICPWNSFSH